MAFRTIVLSVLWLAVLATPASAQITGWFTPNVGGLSGGDTTTAGPVFGASAAAFEGHTWLGAELDVARASSFNDEGIDDSALTTVSVSAIASPHRNRFQPFVLAGVGLLRAEGCAFSCTTRFVETVVTANAGGGFQARLTDWLGIRGDLRYVRALGRHDAVPHTGGGAFDFFRASVGATVIWSQM